jgi:hypothetical protein
MAFTYPPIGVLNINREYRPPTYPTVRVRVLRAHYQLRRLLEVGEIVNLPEPDAANAVALGRAEKV